MRLFRSSPKGLAANIWFFHSQLYPVLRQPLTDTHFLASTLWPNNSSLHPPILYGLFKYWDGVEAFEASTLPVFIYKDLTPASADAVCKMDEEVRIHGQCL